MLIIIRSAKRASKLLETSQYRPVHTGTTVTSYKQARKRFTRNVYALQQHYYAGHVPISVAVFQYLQHREPQGRITWWYDFIVRPCKDNWRDLYEKILTLWSREVLLILYKTGNSVRNNFFGKLMDYCRDNYFIKQPRKELGKKCNKIQKGQNTNSCR